MAGKTYELLFQLSAQLNGAFATSLQRAQTEFGRLENEMKQLNQVQKDVSAYQRQQQSVEKLTQTLKSQEAELQRIKELKAEAEKRGESTTVLEAEEKQLAKAIEETTAKLKAEQEALSQTGEKLKAAGVDTANLSQEEARLRGEMERLEREQKEVGEGAKEASQAQITSFENVASALSAVGITQGLQKIYDMYREFVGVAADFEESMSTVEALSGANAEQMGELSDKAKELGATTKFTAKESADAMGYMAMAQNIGPAVMKMTA